MSKDSFIPALARFGLCWLLCHLWGWEGFGAFILCVLSFGEGERTNFIKITSLENRIVDLESQLKAREIDMPEWDEIAQEYR